MKHLELLWLVVLACSIVILNSAYRLAEQSRQEGIRTCRNEVYKIENCTEEYTQGKYKLKQHDVQSRCNCNPNHNTNLVTYRREEPDIEYVKAYHFCINCECLQDSACAIPEIHKTLFRQVCTNPVCNATDKCRKKVYTLPRGNISETNLCTCGSKKCELSTTMHSDNMLWMDFTCQ